MCLIEMCLKLKSAKVMSLRLKIEGTVQLAVMAQSLGLT